MSVERVVDGAAACDECGRRAALIAGHTYDWLGAQYYREIEAAIHQTNVPPAVAAELATTLLRARESDAELQAALRSVVKIVPSAAVVRAGATVHPLSRQILGILVVLLNAIAADQNG